MLETLQIIALLCQIGTGRDASVVHKSQDLCHKWYLACVKEELGGKSWQAKPFSALTTCIEKRQP